ncbi:uncharacterized protein [Clytia hemisphaerica]|uniref:uncharacterized protein n=1 Tax=Clytia hemisphaerica TaxID=252671 RepID=UPI0034D6448F
MARRRVLFVDWHSINGSANGKRKLSFDENEKGKFTCPAKLCLHSDFESKRGLRKHIDNKHPWYYYFDEQPEVKREEVELNQPAVQRKASTSSKPYYSIDEGIGNAFYKWLTTTCGGGKNDREAKQVAKRAMKFLMNSTGDNESLAPLSYELVDCCLGSTTIILKFLTVLEEEWKMSSSGALNYVKALSDLMDYRKAFGINDNKLRCFTITEVYLRRAKENLRKKKRLDSTRNFDLENLIGRDSWASLEEMERVIPYHIMHYRDIINKCKVQEPLPNKQDLTFCTRFITTFLFLRVKCSRPMTFQYLTLQMIEKAKKTDGFVDQREFKTAGKYLFDTLILTEDVFTVLDTYIDFVRPLMSPTCDYLLVSTTGHQYKSLTTAMTLLVHKAIGKYIHPTRYRQIVETASADRLSKSEQEIISEDQKHSSDVAKVHYKKKQSRIVATQGQKCMEKMLGAARTDQQEAISEVIRDLTSISKSSSSPMNPNQMAGPSSSNNANSSATPFIVETDEENFESNNLDAQCREVNNIMQRVQNMCSSVGNSNASPDDSTDVQMEIISSVKASTPVRSQKRPMYDKTKISNSVTVKREIASKEAGNKKVKFSPMEDNMLLKGIKRHGDKNWAAIIRDKAFDFHQSRTRDSLRVRADSAAFKKLLKK